MSSSAEIVVNQLTRSEQLETLEPLWLALHQYHRVIQPTAPLQPDDRTSWKARVKTYRRWVDEGSAIILTASVDLKLVGYAVAHLESGVDDDTFDFGVRYAELYTLSVLPGRQGKGVGSRLLDELDEVLRSRSVDTVTVSAMTANSRAIDFYQRHGFAPLEVTLQRPVPPRR
jgi:ribosomal protein S18 acetylase RimI-like enzyme